MAASAPPRKNTGGLLGPAKRWPGASGSASAAAKRTTKAWRALEAVAAESKDLFVDPRAMSREESVLTASAETVLAESAADPVLPAGTAESGGKARDRTSTSGWRPS